MRKNLKKFCLNSYEKALFPINNTTNFNQFPIISTQTSFPFDYFLKNEINKEIERENNNKTLLKIFKKNKIIQEKNKNYNFTETEFIKEININDRKFIIS